MPVNKNPLDPKREGIFMSMNSTQATPYGEFVMGKIEQESLHWEHNEVSVDKDVEDYANLSLKEKKFIARVLAFFTQTDVNVAHMYLGVYIPYFIRKGELQVVMMLVSFANMEGTHVLAYDSLPRALGLERVDLSYIKKHKEMEDKQNFFEKFNNDNPEETAFSMAIASGFIEGCVLFSSFAMIMYFSLARGMQPGLDNVLSGIGQIVNLSIRDENLHTKWMIRLFHTFCKEHNVDMKKIASRIYKAVEELLELEFNFIKFCFDGDLIPGLTEEDLQKYMCYLADQRFIQLGFPPIYGYDANSKNPIPWTELFLHLRESANFFECRVTNYSKFGASVKGQGVNWDFDKKAPSLTTAA